MFDAREAKLLTAGNHITFPEQPGLRLEASSTGRSWIYRYKSLVDGRMRQIKIGAWPDISFNHAVVAWEELRKQRNTGSDPATAARAERQAAKLAAAMAQLEAAEAVYTVAKVCDEYWHGHIRPHRAKKGVTEVRRLFDKELGEVAAFPVREVTRAVAFNLIRGIAEKKPVIAGMLRSELGAAWEYAIDAGRLSDETPNWWRQILKGKLRSKGKRIAGVPIGTAKRFLTEAELGMLIAWLPNFSRLLQDTFTLYLWTTCRGAEIVQVEGREIIDEATGLWWNIPKAKTKNHWRENATDLRVPLFGRAKEVMLRRKDRYGDGYLFPSQGGAEPYVQQKTLQSSLFHFQPYCESRPELYRPRLPVTHWAPHDLRRTSRTLLASMGCPHEVGEAILGHMTGVYNRHTYDNERLEWLKRLSDKLEGVAGANF